MSQPRIFTGLKVPPPSTGGSSLPKATTSNSYIIMKLHLPKALAAAVMALFAVPNAYRRGVSFALMLFASGVACADGAVTLGGVSGSWTVYNAADDQTINDNSISFKGGNWGGPTSLFEFSDAITLSTNVTLTLSYTVVSTTTNGVFALTLLGAPGSTAIVTGNTDYSARDIAIASDIRASSGYHFPEAQDVVFKKGNSDDRFQETTASSDNIITSSVEEYTSGIDVTMEVKYKEGLSSYVATMTCGDKTAEVNLGANPFTFTTLVVTSESENTGYVVSNINLTQTPEPTTATLSLLALMGLAARRRRKAAK